MIGNFTVLESVYGKLVINRHCAFQADVLVKTGHTHIEDELAKIMAIVRSLPDGCVVVDAGANAGLVAIPVARHVGGSGGVVHAFEAQRMLCYALGGTVALNDLGNVHVHHRALGARVGTVSAGRPDYAAVQDFGMYSLIEPAAAAAHDDIEVTTIDQLGLTRLDLLKIDVEGMEIDVLQGAQRSLGAFLPWCWVEYWKVGIGPIKGCFVGLDYRFFPMDRLNLLCAPQMRLRTCGFAIDGCEV